MSYLPPSSCLWEGSCLILFPSCLWEGSCLIYVFLCSFTHRGVKHFLNIWVTWRLSYKRLQRLTLRANAWVHLWFLMRFVLFVFLDFCVVFIVLSVFIICLVYPILLVSLDYQFLIAPSGFSDIYLPPPCRCFLLHIRGRVYAKIVSKKTESQKLKTLILLSCILMMICLLIIHTLLTGFH
jgi:hypothetical protein